MSDRIDDHSPTVPSSFFESSGLDYVATALARGPWDPTTAHGGPIAALIGREAERADPDPDLASVRFSIELLRPVPLGRLRLSSTLLRPGRRVRLLGISIHHDGLEVVRSVVLRVRRPPEDAPSVDHAAGPDVPAPDSCPASPPLVDGGVGILDGIELRGAAGSVGVAGPAAVWFRVHRPLVDDEPITPTTRLLLASDFGNGISSELSIATHLFINPDLTVHVTRPPQGEWLLNDAVTTMQPGEAAVAHGRLFDRHGLVANATQCLYVARR